MNPIKHFRNGAWNEKRVILTHDSEKNDIITVRKILSETPPQRTVVASLITKSQTAPMTPIQTLKKLHLEENRRRFPSLPEPCRCAPSYTDRTANGLTKCIIDFLRLKGHQAERVVVMGRYLDNSKIVTDVTGRLHRIGTGKWIPGSMQPGYRHFGRYQWPGG